MKFKYSLICFLLQFTFTNKIFSQTDKTYVNKIVSSSELDSVLFYSKKLQKSTDSCMFYIGKINEYEVYYKKGKYNLVEKEMTKLLNDLKNLNSLCQKKSKISILNRLFWIKKNQNKLDEALKLLKRRLNIVETLSLKNLYYYIHKLSISSNMATIKSNLGLYSEAITILKKTNYELNKLNITQKDKHYRFFLKHKYDNLNKIANSLFRLKKLDSAKLYYRKAFKLIQKSTNKNIDHEIFYDIRMANILIKKERYYDAYNLIQKYDSLQVSQRIKKNFFFLKAIIFKAQNHSGSSIFYSKKYLTNPENYSFPLKNKINIYDILASEYYKLNKIDSAYKYSQLTLKHFNLAKEDKEKTFNFLYKNDYNKIQKLNIEIKDRENKKQRNLITAFIGLLTALIVIVTFILRSEKKKKNLLIKEIKTQKNTGKEKKKYNIDEELENRIINEIKKVNVDLCFLKSDFSISTIANRLKTNIIMSHLINITQS